MRYMKLNVFFLYFMSMYPAGRNAGWFLHFLLYFWRVVCVFGLVSLSALCMVDVALRDEFNFVDVSSNFMNTGLFLGAAVRAMYYYAYGEKVRTIIDMINAHFRDESETGMEEKTMKSAKFVAVAFCWTWGITVIFTVELITVLPLAFIHKTGKALAIQAWYPYDWKLPGWYELTFMGQVLTQFFMGFGYGGADMFYVCATYLSAGQFEIIGWEMENVVYTALLRFGVAKERVVAFSKTFNGFGVEGSMKEDVVEYGNAKASKEYDDIMTIIASDEFAPVLRQSFVNCLGHHQKLLDVCDLMYKFFSPVLLPSLAASLCYTIFIPFTLLITTDRSAFIGLIQYVAASFTQVFIVAIFGQLLHNASEKLIDSLYVLPWYICDNKFQTTFKFAQFRASKPFIIKAGGYFAVDLGLFLNIFRTSASYFAVLRQVTESEPLQG